MLPARCLEFRVFLIVFVNPTIPYVILIVTINRGLSKRVFPITITQPSNVYAHDQQNRYF